MKVSDNYLSVVDKFIFSGVPIQHMRMTEEQKLRTLIAYEAYQVWMTNKQIRPMDLCKRISSRIYSDMLLRAESDPKYMELCKSLKIRPGVPRDYQRLCNDVQTLDHIIGRFSNPTVNIEKAKVIDSSDWLIEEGMKRGNENSVKSGAELKMKLYNNFDERESGYDNIANTDINITGDISVVKPDRKNYTEEQKREYAKRFGLPDKEVEELIRNSDGVYEFSGQVEEEEENDIFMDAEEGR